MLTAFATVNLEQGVSNVHLKEEMDGFLASPIQSGTSALKSKYLKLNGKV